MGEREPLPLPVAWEPVTPRGVAAFARADTGRLFLAQCVVALLVAGVIVWFLHGAWGGTIRAGIENLPEEGEIRSGQLDWRSGSPQLLAEGNFLAFSVGLEHTNVLRSAAHLQVEFGRETVLLRSLAGHMEVRYPDHWIIAFNRKELNPWWGAWQPALLAGAAVAVFAGLLVLWQALATLYAGPVWLAAFFANRDLTLAEACRLSGAALLPGALLMGAGIVLYGLGLVDLIGLAFVTAGHVVLGWLYLLLSVSFLPKHPSVSGRGNPFARTGSR